MGGVDGWNLLLLETPGEVGGRDVVEKNTEEMNRRLHQVTTRITNHGIVVAGERERGRGRERGREREREIVKGGDMTAACTCTMYDVMHTISM